MQAFAKGLCLTREDRKRVLTITLPSLFELVLSHLFTMVDTIMLGRSAISAVAIAAVGLTNNPMNLTRSILLSLNIGTTAGVAWAIGAKEQKSAMHISRNAVMLNSLVGMIASLLVFTFAGQIVTFMGAGADTYEYARTYLRIIALGLFPQSITFAVTASLRGVGQTRLPMTYNLIANMCNVIGNYVLIYGKFGFPALGVTGAALSTALSQVLGCALALFTAFRAHTPVRFFIDRNWRMSLRWIRRILSVGLTSMLEQLIMQVGFVIFARQVSGLGTTIFAAHQIGLNINGLTWMPGQAFGVAATTLVGQSLGAGEKEKATDFVKLVHRLSMSAAAVIAVLFLTCSQFIAGLYTTDLEVAALSAGVLKLIALGMPGISTQLPIAAALRGARDTRFPLMASMAGIWIFRVMLAPLFIYTFGWGLTGAWLTIVLDQTTRAAVVYARFRTERWLTVGERAKKRENS